MLKIMHISDFRIDSPQPFMLPEAAEKRKQDISEALIDFCEKASDYEPDAILISGNLIDLSCASTENILRIIDIFSHLTQDSKIHLFMVSGPIEFSGNQEKNTSFLNSFVRNQYIHVFPDTRTFSSITVKSKEGKLFSVYGKSYDSTLKNVDDLIPKHENPDIPAILLTPALPNKITDKNSSSNLPVLSVETCIEKNFSYLCLGGIEKHIVSDDSKWSIPGSPERITLSGDGGNNKIIQIILKNNEHTDNHDKANETEAKNSSKQVKAPEFIAEIEYIPLKVKDIVDISICLDLSVFSISDKVLEDVMAIDNKNEKILFLQLEGEISFEVFKRYDRIELIKKLLKLFHNVILLNNMSILDSGSMEASKHPFSPNPQDVFNKIINEKISEADQTDKQDFKDILIRARDLGNKIIDLTYDSEYGEQR